MTQSDRINELLERRERLMREMRVLIYSFIFAAGFVVGTLVHHLK